MPSSSAPKSRDQRGAARFDTALPVRIEGIEGETQNISAHGVYFETDVAPTLGALLNFTVEFNQYGGRQSLLCEGKVVRIDALGDRFGVAARLLAPFFEVEEVVAVSLRGASVPA
jgi:hypothetical protein